jgi:CPA1 family monovalent cation:H+ antiporter
VTFFQTAALLLTFAAVAAYANNKFLRLPRTIGLMAIALALTTILVLLALLGVFDLEPASAFVRSIDFSGTLLHGMLAFLLFAGALHVDLNDLLGQAVPVVVLSTVGVVVATFVAGSLFWIVGGWLWGGLSLVSGLLFGALISPTDPIAVLGILKKAGATKTLETVFTGESLFNDGVGVVVFLTILGIATGHAKPTVGSVALFFLVEAAGGLVLGFGLGWIVYRLLRSVDAYQVEILLTLALAAGGYSLAEAVHVSAPITIVVAGLFIGNHGRAFAMSEKTLTNLDTFWELIDEILNAVLFVIIGLEIIAVDISASLVIPAVASVLIVLVARFASVTFSAMVMRPKQRFEKGSIGVLTWGGLRGGISIALALSLPPGPERQLILSATYVVVVFSILVQGLTITGLIKAKRPKIVEGPMGNGGP